MKLDLSIIIPTLNCLKTLRWTFESIRPLKEAGVKVIVADSFSSDGTREAAANFADRIVEVPKGNMYVAINAGMAVASTEWLGYINADDIIYPRAIEKAFSELPNNLDLIYGCLDFIDSDGRFLHGFITPPARDIIPLGAMCINAVPPQGAFFRRRIFERLGGFDTRLRLAGDFDFFLRAKKEGFKFRRVLFPPLAAYRMHPAQYSQTQNNALHIEGWESIGRNGIKAALIDKVRSFVFFKLRNIDGYILRLIRSRQLFGAYRGKACMDFDE